MRFIILATFSCYFYHFANTQTNFHDTWMNPLSICTNEKLTIEGFNSLNTLPPEDFESCIKPFENISIIWLKFVADKESVFSFQLTPLNIHDDLDFALFESNNGIPGKLVRCMATGLLLDRYPDIQNNCTGSTGLRNQEIDYIELPGCSEDQNNFVSAVSVQNKQEYLLLITNFNSAEGFILDWGNESIISYEPCREEEVQTDFIRLFIHPNPVYGILNYTIKSDIQGPIDLLLVSSNGNILLSEKQYLAKGENSYSMSLNKYAPGSYYLYLSGETGTKECIKFEVIK